MLFARYIVASVEKRQIAISVRPPSNREDHLMFSLEQFIADCRAALAQDKTHRAVREVVARAVADPPAVLRALGEPSRGGVNKLYHAPDLTILNLVWAPRMTLLPHNHNMWAVIGIYTGREDNVFWRRLGTEGARRVEAAGAKALSEKEAEPLGENIIHSVTNPIGRLTGAIHVYGGDFFGTARSEWDAETLLEQPFDFARNLRLFEEANAAARLN
jgi:predicted metal-dependent enzyme (double-stranded beta helix superfamily)